MVDEDVDIPTISEYNPLVQFFENIDIEEETQDDPSILYTMELRVSKKP